MFHIVSLVALGILLWIVHWLDAFHLVCAILSVLACFFVIYSIKRAAIRRAEAEEKERAVFIKSVLDLNEEEEHSSSVGRNIVLGVLQGGLLLLITLIFVSVLKSTPVYGLFYDRDYKSIIAKVEVYQEIGANEQIFKLVSERVEQTVSKEKQKELATIAYKALVAWGDSLKDNKERSGKFDQAVKFAEKWKLDKQLAEARLEIEQLKESILGPTDLPEGVRGYIAQIDKSIFPPSIAIYVGIENRDGKVLEGIEKKDLKISVDGVPTTNFYIARISEEDESNIALLVDVSGSTAGDPLESGKVGIQELINLCGPKDHLALIQFSNGVKYLTSWQDEKELVPKALKSVKAQGRTLLYDAIALALKDLSGFPGKKAIVLFTDGKDTGSKNSVESVLGKAKVEKIPIYTVGLASPDLAVEVLDRISKETQGEFKQAANCDEIAELYKFIGSKIKNQYRVVLDPGVDSDSVNLSIQIGRKNRIVLLTNYSLKGE